MMLQLRFTTLLPLLAILGFSVSSVSFAQDRLAALPVSAYQKDLKDAHCVAYFNAPNTNLLGVAINGSGLYLNLNNSGLLYLTNIHYESRQGDIQFFGKLENNVNGPSYHASLKNIKKRSNQQYGLDLELYMARLGEHPHLLLTQTLILKETCPSGVYGSVRYQRSNFSKLMQFLFFKH